MPALSPRPSSKPGGKDDPQVDFNLDGGLVTLHTDELDVRRLLELISRRSGMNLAISPKVQGAITANFEKVTTQDLLRSVLKLANLVEKVDGELYNVEFETFKDVKDPGKTKK